MNYASLTYAIGGGGRDASYCGWPVSICKREEKMIQLQRGHESGNPYTSDTVPAE